jgi:hypothetical protein
VTITGTLALILNAWDQGRLTQDGLCRVLASHASRHANGNIANFRPRAVIGGVVQPDTDLAEVAS